MLDIPTVTFISVLVCFGLTVAMLNSSLPSERVLLICIIGMLIAYVYHLKKQSSAYDSKTNMNAELVIDTIKSYYDVSEDSVMPLRMVLTKDYVLLNLTTQLLKFKDLDAALIKLVCFNMLEFYNQYSNILMNGNPSSVIKDVPCLIDKRFELLRNLHQLYTSIPQKEYSKDIERIIVGVQASTYKCMNILKNKYGIANSKPPYPVNLFTQSIHDTY